MAGAPLGNKNGAKQNRIWGETIRRVVAQGKAEKIRKLAEVLVAKAEEGDIAALKEIGDRLDGKSAQQVQIQGDPNEPLRIIHESR